MRDPAKIKIADCPALRVYVTQCEHVGISLVSEWLAETDDRELAILMRTSENQVYTQRKRVEEWLETDADDEVDRADDTRQDRIDMYRTALSELEPVLEDAKNKVANLELARDRMLRQIEELSGGVSK
jgi:hypothetical protein